MAAKKNMKTNRITGVVDTAKSTDLTPPCLPAPVSDNNPVAAQTDAEAPAHNQRLSILLRTIAPTERFGIRPLQPRPG